MIKQSLHRIKGMNKDVSPSLHSNEYAVDNFNIRIQTTEEGSLYRVTNEKGVKEFGKVNEDSYDIERYFNIKGKILGKAQCNKGLVIFTSANMIYYIYGVDFQDKETSVYVDIIWNSEIQGTLFGDTLECIQTLVIETNDEIKVYFVQQNNPPRVLRITPEMLHLDYSKIYQKSTDFDFIPEISNTNFHYNITKKYNTSGIFPSGVIQYAFSYIDQNGRESKLFSITPLYYISNEERGNSPEESVLNSFSIELENIDKSFEYIRIYSIQRTSLDTTPICRILDDIQIKKEYISTENIKYLNSDNIEIINTTTKESKTLTEWINLGGLDEGNLYFSYPYTIKNKENNTYIKLPNTSITINTVNQIISAIDCTIDPYFYYIDLNQGSIIDPSLLFYIGGEEFYAGAITQKNNTLFLGNIVLPKKIDYTQNILGDYSFGTTIKSITYAEKPDYYYSYDLKLNRNSSEIKVFKGGETYRLGVQLQDKKGNWSEPIVIKDWKNDNYPQFSYDRYYIKDYKVDFTLPTIELDTDTVNNLYQSGIRKIRPIIVYPNDNNREVLFQGVVNPTVYNTEDRYTNTPYSQASWFFRPIPPYKIKEHRSKLNSDLTMTIIDPYVESDYTDFYQSTTINPVNKRALVSTGGWKVTKDNPAPNYKPVLNEDGTENKRLPNVFYPQGYDFTVDKMGDITEFRHNYPIPGNQYKNAEIQNIVNPKQPFKKDEVLIDDYIKNNKEYYYVDQNIVTLNSPDIEFNDDYKNIDLSKYKFRIVGIIPLTSNYSDLDITTETTPLKLTSYLNEDFNYKEQAKGFIKNLPNTTGNSIEHNYHYGYRTLLTSVSWYDEIWRSAYSKYELDNYYSGTIEDGYINTFAGLKDTTQDQIDEQHTGFVIYPWHRNGSLNNQRFAEDDGYISAKLKQKRMSNFRFSYGSLYINTLQDSEKYIPSDIQLFTSEEIKAVKLKTPEGSKIPFWNYYGNIDKINSTNKEYPITIANRGYITENIFNNTTAYGSLDDSINDSFESGSTLYTMYKTNGYGTLLYMVISGRKDYYGEDYLKEKRSYAYGTDPVHIKYSSSPHAVISLNYYTNDKNYIYQQIIPPAYNSGFINLQENKLFWDANIKGYGFLGNGKLSSLLYNVKGPSIDAPKDGQNLQFGYLYLGEIYRDVENKFGDIDSCIWQPCGKEVEINSNKITTVTWEEGDTYYQRYDCIKTYPTTTEDQNSMTEVLSFMCETRINLDLRYDKNRQNISYIYTNRENTNKINSVYQQKDNFFTYRKTDLNLYNKNLDFPNTVVWSLTKEKGSLIDTWTNITAGASLELNGECGRITSLLNNNDSIIAFQEKGISNILYNEQTQITTTSGVPIEISNSGKVTGSRYITTQLGAQKSISICTSLTGIYFIDYNNKGIYFLSSGGITNLTETLGFNSWVKNIETPRLNDNSLEDNIYHIFYDTKNSEILFTNKEEAFGYSEFLKSFTSFYSYEGVNLLGNIIQLNTNKVYPIIFQYNSFYNYSHPTLYQEGEYNYFFGTYKPFYVTIIENSEPLKDKVFNTVEFRADTWTNYNNLSTLIPFTHLTVWNEYQQGESNLNFKEGISNLQKKFRIWRANIPRDKKSKFQRDRIRNPWVYIKLESKGHNSKVTLNDIVVSYT